MAKATVGPSAGDLGTQVAERLAEELFSGVYAPGDLLPKETELCDRFGISRASLRSGLQRLVALRIISRVAGQGTTVQEYRDWNILDPAVTRWIASYAGPNPQFLREIFEFRYATEPFIAMLAAQNASARDLLAMEEAFAGMAHSVESGQLAWQGRSFSDYDVEFHAAIYRATGNLVWAQLAHILRPSITVVVRKSNDEAGELRDSLGRHRRLMELIRLRRPAEAFEAARNVLTRTAFDLGLTTDAPGNTPDMSWNTRPPIMTEGRRD